MLDYLKKVLELVRPYRVRFGLGLLCGFLSGALAFTLPLSLKVALGTVFPNRSSSRTVAVSSTTATNLSPAALPVAGAVAAAPEGAKTSPEPAKPASKRGFNIQPPAPLKKTLERIGNWFRPPDHPSRLRMALAIALIPGAMLVRGLLGYLNIYLLSWVGIRAANDLRTRLFAHLIHLPMNFFNHASTGDVMARLEGALTVNNTINGAFAVMIREPISIVVLVVGLLAWQPLLSLATLIVFPICLVPVIAYGRRLRKSNSNVWSRFARVSTVTHEAITGIRVVKGFNLETQMVEQFRRAADAVTSFFMRSVRASELPGPMIEFIGAVGVALVFSYFAFIAPDNSKVDVDDLLTFFIAVFGLYQPVKNLSRLHGQLELARTSMDPVFKWLEVQNTLTDPAQPKPLKASGAPIRFENVSFAYARHPVLYHINLNIKPGQLVALVGRTGSGKSSIANLLLRFYDPQRGAILIGETDLREVSLHDLRANISVVTQQTILFNDTIRSNIAMGRLGATEEEIVAAAKHAFAHDFIMEKPQGYETIAGEKGANLSGGQQQRIAIARAILKNAPILILDEATSALDTEAERVVQAALEELMRGRTTICIAHRLSTIQRADLIVVLDNGHIVETGTHAELLQAGGIYRKLYELQFEATTVSA